jgi:hypothetical protein
MSKNTNLSFLTDFLTADIVNSRVGMNNVSPQSTFDVTGTGKFSGILTLGSTVSNGTYTYTLPSATGTLALTSDIPSVSGYVPYTGASQDVNLGVNTLTSKGLNVDVIAGQGGALNLRQATNFSTWIGAPFTSIYATPNNKLIISFSNDNRSITLDGSIVSAASPRTFTFPDATGTFALTSQIPTNAVGGTGTLNTIPKFTAATTIGNSNIFDSGSIIYNTNPTAGQYAWQFGGSTVTGQSYGAQVVAGTNASDIGFKVMNAAASINYLVVRGDGLVTLTGALNGTSATFSGLITGQTTSAATITQNFLAYNSGSSISGASYDFQSGGTSQTARISANYEASSPDRMAMRFLVGQGSGLVEILKLFNSTMTVTGAATFSSSVSALSLDVISASGVGSSTASGLARFITAGTTTAISVGQANSARKLDLSSYSVSTTGEGLYLSTLSNHPIYFSTNSVDRAIISSNGNLGIGDLIPDEAKLVVRSSDDISTTNVGFFASLSNNNGGICLRVDSTNRFGIIQSAGTNSGLKLQYNSGGTETTGLTLTSVGNVGIGTTGPQSRLQLNSIGSTMGLTGDAALRIAGGTFGTDQIVFGYSESGGYSPAVFGYIATTATGYQFGDLFFATRSVTTNTAPTERMRITSGGNVGIGSTGYSGIKLQITSATSDSSSFAFSIANSSVQDLFYVRSDGYMNTGSRASSPYNLTSGNAANMVVGADGTLYRSTSSLKYKTDIVNYDKGLAEVMQIRPVYYKSINEREKDLTFAGLIAEEIEELGLTEFVQYAEDGTPDALAYSNMVALLVKAIQELNEKINK